MLPPRAASYSWSAKREGKNLTLTGYYPDDGTRYMMKQAVAQRFSDFKLTDRTSIASGAPAGFSAAMGMALDQLSLLDSGEASIANGRLAISGIAADDKTAAGVREALTKLVGGMPTEAKLTVQTPPSPPAPAATPAPVAPPVAAIAPSVAPTVTAQAPATSTVPATSGKAAAQAAAGTSPSPAAATPAPVAPVAPAAKQAAPAAAPPMVGAPAPTTSAPVATAKPATAPVTAPAKQTTSPTTPATTALAAAPQAAGTAPASTANCPANAGTKIRAGRIRFASSSAKVMATSRKRLLRIADILKKCPTVKIEIGGHTDSTGRTAFNDALSKRRAEAVRVALLNRGIDATRLVAVGYGSSKPLGDNRKASGKASNRRIEFTVVQ